MLTDILCLMFPWHIKEVRLLLTTSVLCGDCIEWIWNTVTSFGPKVGQIGPKWDKSETFSAHNSVHFGSVSENVLKLCDLKRSQICLISGPIWPILDPNLTSLFQTTHYTLHAQTLEVGQPDILTKSLLWAVLIRVTRLVAHSQAILLNERGNIYTNWFQYS